MSPKPAIISELRIDVPMTPEAAEYCQRHDLGSSVELAVEIATRAFRPVEPIWVELQIDPETDEEKLLMNTPVVGSVEEILERDRAFGREWIAVVTPDVQVQISLFLDIRDSE